MSDWNKFKNNLSRHPGVPVMWALMGLGFVAGFSRVSFPDGIVGGLFGVGVMSAGWIVVLWTAWTGRNQ